jgi:hypothetical protein
MGSTRSRRLVQAAMAREVHEWQNAFERTLFAHFGHDWRAITIDTANAAARNDQKEQLPAPSFMITLPYFRVHIANP